MFTILSVSEMANPCLWPPCASFSTKLPFSSPLVFVPWDFKPTFKTHVIQNTNRNDGGIWQKWQLPFPRFSNNRKSCQPVEPLDDHGAPRIRLHPRSPRIGILGALEAHWIPSASQTGFVFTWWYFLSIDAMSVNLWHQLFNNSMFSSLIAFSVISCIN